MIRYALLDSVCLPNLVEVIANVSAASAKYIRFDVFKAAAIGSMHSRNPLQFHKRNVLFLNIENPNPYETEQIRAFTQPFTQNRRGGWIMIDEACVESKNPTHMV
jgi:hypothetical protein